MDRFDVVFSEGNAEIDHHFCREVDCFGTNETHGLSFDEAKEIVVKYLEQRLAIWRAMSFESWRRSRHPTEKEMYEDIAMAEDIYALQQEEWLARNEQ